jgi:hypothetical protein
MDARRVGRDPLPAAVAVRSVDASSATAGTPCHSGKCFGAELGQNYAQCQRGFLLSPALDLSACVGEGPRVASDGHRRSVFRW